MYVCVCEFPYTTMQTQHLFCQCFSPSLSLLPHFIFCINHIPGISRIVSLHEKMITYKSTFQRIIFSKVQIQQLVSKCLTVSVSISRLKAVICVVTVNGTVKQPLILTCSFSTIILRIVYVSKIAMLQRHMRVNCSMR